MSENTTMHILHIEDDPADAELTEIALRGGGLSCDIRLAKSRKECLSALESGEFDLVLSDSHGHDLKGLEVLHLVRERLPDVPFVFLSGSFDDCDPEELKAEGAAECILKDDLEALVLVIRRLMQQPL